MTTTYLESMSRRKILTTVRGHIGGTVFFGACALALLVFLSLSASAQPDPQKTNPDELPRKTISLNQGWRFFKYARSADADTLVYDVRPDVGGTAELQTADARPTEAASFSTAHKALKHWILPTANAFIKDSTRHHVRPEGNPGHDFPFVQTDFNDSSWQQVNLPHDWAISGPFQEGPTPEVGGGMGRLPVNGVAWYRKKISFPASDTGKSVFLLVEGAMSYAMVWLNGHLVGGWPYGYNSWKLDLTPFIRFGKENQLAIRVDNPNYSARWYSGGGLYRNVWITLTEPVHVDQWGTFILSREVSSASATLDLAVTLSNDSEQKASPEVSTALYELDALGRRKGKAVAAFSPQTADVAPGEKTAVKSTLILNRPRLWGPPPTQQPHLYLAVTTLRLNGQVTDRYETRFGIRRVEFHPGQGILVNGESIPLKGVNQHHDLGALGAAFNRRAAERQLEILKEMGCNAIRMSHNPPAPGLLELTDRMGFLVINEIFDSWELKKTPHDFHLIFPEWAEPDLRAFIRRDRNAPSVILWSFGNEVGEQYTGEAGAATARRLLEIIREEDPSRPTTLAMNYAKPIMPIAAVPDVIGLNYQGEGIRQEPEFEGTDRIRTAPQYAAFRERFPDKVLYSSETASAFSSRGIYLFPVSELVSAPVRDGRGGDSRLRHVTSYELHAVDFGSSADKVFASLDKHPFVAGEFVWTGFDYLGEPTPYYESRSSYTGIIDLAGFKKDRFYLYQAHWRPDLPMAHLLPHWSWPDRVGETTPVHLFTSGDEAELFLNGRSLGRKIRNPYEYRLRWDEVKYEPGELRVIVWKNGRKWAEERVTTAGEAAGMRVASDRMCLSADGHDLAFVTVSITDSQGKLVPRAGHLVTFTVDGPADLVATDNGDPTDMTAFPSPTRKAFSGNALAIIRTRQGEKGKVTVTATAPGVKEARVVLQCR